MSIWSAFALAAIVTLPGWPALFKTLLAYGYAARIPVAIVMFFAFRGNWASITTPHLRTFLRQWVSGPNICGSVFSSTDFLGGVHDCGGDAFRNCCRGARSPVPACLASAVVILVEELCAPAIEVK